MATKSNEVFRRARPLSLDGTYKISPPDVYPFDDSDPTHYYYYLVDNIPFIRHDDRDVLMSEMVQTGHICGFPFKGNSSEDLTDMTPVIVDFQNGYIHRDFSRNQGQLQNYEKIGVVLSQLGSSSPYYDDSGIRTYFVAVNVQDAIVSISKINNGTNPMSTIKPEKSVLYVDTSGNLCTSLVTNRMQDSEGKVIQIGVIKAVIPNQNIDALGPPQYVVVSFHALGNFGPATGVTDAAHKDLEDIVQASQNRVNPGYWVYGHYGYPTRILAIEVPKDYVLPFDVGDPVTIDRTGQLVKYGMGTKIRVSSRDETGAVIDTDKYPTPFSVNSYDSASGVSILPAELESVTEAIKTWESSWTPLLGFVFFKTFLFGSAPNGDLISTLTTTQSETGETFAAIKRQFVFVITDGEFYFSKLNFDAGKIYYIARDSSFANLITLYNAAEKAKAGVSVDKNTLLLEIHSSTFAKYLIPDSPTATYSLGKQLSSSLVGPGVPVHQGFFWNHGASGPHPVSGVTLSTSSLAAKSLMVSADYIQSLPDWATGPTSAFNWGLNYEKSWNPTGVVYPPETNITKSDDDLPGFQVPRMGAIIHRLSPEYWSYINPSPIPTPVSPPTGTEPVVKPPPITPPTERPPTQGPPRPELPPDRYPHPENEIWRPRLCSHVGKLINVATGRVQWFYNGSEVTEQQASEIIQNEDMSCGDSGGTTPQSSAGGVSTSSGTTTVGSSNETLVGTSAATGSTSLLVPSTIQASNASLAGAAPAQSTDLTQGLASTGTGTFYIDSSGTPQNLTGTGGQIAFSGARVTYPGQDVYGRPTMTWKGRPFMPGGSMGPAGNATTASDKLTAEKSDTTTVTDTSIIPNPTPTIPPTVPTVGSYERIFFFLGSSLTDLSALNSNSELAAPILENANKHLPMTSDVETSAHAIPESGNGDTYIWSKLDGGNEFQGMTTGHHDYVVVSFAYSTVDGIDTVDWFNRDYPELYPISRTTSVSCWNFDNGTGTSLKTENGVLGFYRLDGTTVNAHCFMSYKNYKVMFGAEGGPYGKYYVIFNDCYVYTKDQKNFDIYRTGFNRVISFPTGAMTFSVARDSGLYLAGLYNPNPLHMNWLNKHKVSYFGQDVKYSVGDHYPEFLLGTMGNPGLQLNQSGDQTFISTLAQYSMFDTLGALPKVLTTASQGPTINFYPYINDNTMYGNPLAPSEINQRTATLFRFFAADRFGFMGEPWKPFADNFFFTSPWSVTVGPTIRVGYADWHGYKLFGVGGVIYVYRPDITKQYYIDVSLDPTALPFQVFGDFGFGAGSTTDESAYTPLSRHNLDLQFFVNGTYRSVGPGDTLRIYLQPDDADDLRFKNKKGVDFGTRTLPQLTLEDTTGVGATTSTEIPYFFGDRPDSSTASTLPTNEDPTVW